ncbi:MAG: 4Fe-4S dicluster domain-containing protein, partial [Planctomycetota bacterium]
MTNNQPDNRNDELNGTPCQIPNPRKWLVDPDFVIERDPDKCIECEVCARQCSNGVHEYDEDNDQMQSDNAACVGCHRCATL